MSIGYSWPLNLRHRTDHHRDPDPDNPSEQRVTGGRLYIQSGRNLATKIMGNGVEVIVRGDKTNYIGFGQTPLIQPMSVNSRPTTFPPSTVSRQFMLVEHPDKPNNAIDHLLHSIVRSATPDMVTKTLITKFTYMTTMLKDRSTVVSSREETISNVMTQKFRPTIEYTPSLKAEASTLPPEYQSLHSSYITNTLTTLYTYYNTFSAGLDKSPVVISSLETVTNQYTRPAYLTINQSPTYYEPHHGFGTFSPSRVFESETYYTTFTFTKKILGSGVRTPSIVTTKETVTQVVVTELLVPPTNSYLLTPMPMPTTTMMTMSPQFSPAKTRTYITTYTHLLTSLRGSQMVVTSSISLSSNIVVNGQTITMANPISPTFGPGVSKSSLYPPALGLKITRTEPVQIATNNLEPVMIYATKTYLTTFTYLTSFVGGNGGSRISSRTQVVSNIVTEAIKTSLNAEYLNALKSSYLARHSTLLEITSTVKEIIPTRTITSSIRKPTLITESTYGPYYPKDHEELAWEVPLEKPPKDSHENHQNQHHFDEMKDPINHIVSVLAGSNNLNDNDDELSYISPSKTTLPLYSTIEIHPGQFHQHQGSGPGQSHTEEYEENDGTTFKPSGSLDLILELDDTDTDEQTTTNSIDFLSDREKPLSHIMTPPLSSAAIPIKDQIHGKPSSEMHNTYSMKSSVMPRPKPPATLTTSVNKFSQYIDDFLHEEIYGVDSAEESSRPLKSKSTGYSITKSMIRAKPTTTTTTSTVKVMQSKSKKPFLTIDPFFDQSFPTTTVPFNGAGAIWGNSPPSSIISRVIYSDKVDPTQQIMNLLSDLTSDSDFYDEMKGEEALKEHSNEDKEPVKIYNLKSTTTPRPRPEKPQPPKKNTTPPIIHKPPQVVEAEDKISTAEIDHHEIDLSSIIDELNLATEGSNEEESSTSSSNSNIIPDVTDIIPADDGSSNNNEKDSQNTGAGAGTDEESETSNESLILKVSSDGSPDPEFVLKVTSKKPNRIFTSSTNKPKPLATPPHADEDAAAYISINNKKKKPLNPLYELIDKEDLPPSSTVYSLTPYKDPFVKDQQTSTGEEENAYETDNEKDENDKDDGTSGENEKGSEEESEEDHHDAGKRRPPIPPSSSSNFGPSGGTGPSGSGSGPSGGASLQHTGPSAHSGPSKSTLNLPGPSGPVGVIHSGGIDPSGGTSIGGINWKPLLNLGAVGLGGLGVSALTKLSPMLNSMAGYIKSGLLPAIARNDSTNGHDEDRINYHHLRPPPETGHFVGPHNEPQYIPVGSISHHHNIPRRPVLGSPQQSSASKEHELRFENGQHFGERYPSSHQPHPVQHQNQNLLSQMAISVAAVNKYKNYNNNNNNNGEQQSSSNSHEHFVKVVPGNSVHLNGNGNGPALKKDMRRPSFGQDQDLRRRPQNQQQRIPSRSQETGLNWSPSPHGHLILPQPPPQQRPTILSLRPATLNEIQQNMNNEEDHDSPVHRQPISPVMVPKPTRPNFKQWQKIKHSGEQQENNQQQQNELPGPIRILNQNFNNNNNRFNRPPPTGSSEERPFNLDIPIKIPPPARPTKFQNQIHGHNSQQQDSNEQLKQHPQNNGFMPPKDINFNKIFGSISTPAPALRRPLNQQASNEFPIRRPPPQGQQGNNFVHLRQPQFSSQESNHHNHFNRRPINNHFHNFNPNNRRKPQTSADQQSQETSQQQQQQQQENLSLNHQDDLPVRSNENEGAGIRDSNEISNEQHQPNQYLRPPSPPQILNQQNQQQGSQEHRPGFFKPYHESVENRPGPGGGINMPQFRPIPQQGPVYQMSSPQLGPVNSNENNNNNNRPFNWSPNNSNNNNNNNIRPHSHEKLPNFPHQHPSAHFNQQQIRPTPHFPPSFNQRPATVFIVHETYEDVPTTSTSTTDNTLLQQQQNNQQQQQNQHQQQPPSHFTKNSNLPQLIVREEIPPTSSPSPASPIILIQYTPEVKTTTNPPTTPYTRIANKGMISKLNFIRRFSTTTTSTTPSPPLVYQNENHNYDNDNYVISPTIKNIVEKNSHLHPNLAFISTTNNPNPSSSSLRNDKMSISSSTSPHVGNIKEHFTNVGGNFGQDYSGSEDSESIVDPATSTVIKSPFGNVNNNNHDDIFSNIKPTLSDSEEDDLFDGFKIPDGFFGPSTPKTLQGSQNQKDTWWSTRRPHGHSSGEMDPSNFIRRSSTTSSPPSIMVVKPMISSTKKPENDYERPTTFRNTLKATTYRPKFGPQKLPSGEGPTVVSPQSFYDDPDSLGDIQIKNMELHKIPQQLKPGGYINNNPSSTSTTPSSTEFSYEDDEYEYSSEKNNLDAPIIKKPFSTTSTSTTPNYKTIDLKNTNTDSKSEESIRIKTNDIKSSTTSNPTTNQEQSGDEDSSGTFENASFEKIRPPGYPPLNRLKHPVPPVLAPNQENQFKFTRIRNQNRNNPQINLNQQISKRPSALDTLTGFFRNPAPPAGTGGFRRRPQLISHQQHMNNINNRLNNQQQQGQQGLQQQEPNKDLTPPGPPGQNKIIRRPIKPMRNNNFIRKPIMLQPNGQGGQFFRRPIQNHQNNLGPPNFEIQQNNFNKVKPIPLKPNEQQQENNDGKQSENNNNAQQQKPSVSEVDSNISEDPSQELYEDELDENETLKVPTIPTHLRPLLNPNPNPNNPILSNNNNNNNGRPTGGHIMNQFRPNSGPTGPQPGPNQFKIPYNNNRPNIFSQQQGSVENGGGNGNFFIRRPQRPGQQQNNINNIPPRTELEPPPIDSHRLKQPILELPSNGPIRYPRPPGSGPSLLRPNLLRPDENIHKNSQQQNSHTIHTIASVDHDNKIIGTNTFTALISRSPEFNRNSQNIQSTPILIQPTSTFTHSTPNPSTIAVHGQNVNNHIILKPSSSENINEESYEDDSYEYEDEIFNEATAPIIRPTKSKIMIKSTITRSRITSTSTSTTKPLLNNNINQIASSRPNLNLIKSQSKKQNLPEESKTIKATSVTRGYTGPSKRPPLLPKFPTTTSPNSNDINDSSEESSTRSPQLAISKVRKPFVPTRNPNLTPQWNRKSTTTTTKPSLASASKISENKTQHPYRSRGTTTTENSISSDENDSEKVKSSPTTRPSFTTTSTSRYPFSTYNRRTRLPGSFSTPGPISIPSTTTSQDDLKTSASTESQINMKPTTFRPFRRPTSQFQNTSSEKVTTTLASNRFGPTRKTSTESSISVKTSTSRTSSQSKETVLIDGQEVKNVSGERNYNTRNSGESSSESSNEIKIKPTRVFGSNSNRNSNNNNNDKPNSKVIQRTRSKVSYHDSGPISSSEKTRYITQTETLTMTYTETETSIMLDATGNPVTHTIIITTTIPPQTQISTIIGQHTMVNTVEIKPTIVKSTITSEATKAIFTVQTSKPKPTDHSNSKEKSKISISHENSDDDDSVNDLDHINPNGKDNNLLLGGIVTVSGTRSKSSKIPQSSTTFTSTSSTTKPDISNEITSSTSFDLRDLNGPIFDSELACKSNCSINGNQMCRLFANGTRAKCVCKPGYARLKLKYPCRPTYTYEMSLAITHMEGMSFDFKDLKNEASDAYLNFISVTASAIERAFDQTDFRRQFQGTDIMKVTPKVIERNFTIEPKVSVDFLVQLTANMTENRLKNQLIRTLKNSNFSIGDTGILSTREMADFQARDYDECSNPNYNDCSLHAKCLNIKGSFTCLCKPGFKDRSRRNSKPGRDCYEMSGCSKCNYKGNCYVDTYGNQACDCERWFGGAECQINLKVLLISIIGIGTVLLLLVFMCVVMLCCKKKRNRERPGSGRFMRYRSPTSQATLDRTAIMNDSASSDATTPPPIHRHPHSFTPDSLLMESPDHHKGVGLPKRGQSDLMNFSLGNVIMDSQDRSLTVVIPRAKLSSTRPPPPPLPQVHHQKHHHLHQSHHHNHGSGPPGPQAASSHHQNNLDNISEIVPNNERERKLINYLEPGAFGDHFNKGGPNSSKQSTLRESLFEKRGFRKLSLQERRISSGALVSSGTEVSAKGGLRRRSTGLEPDPPTLKGYEKSVCVSDQARSYDEQTVRSHAKPLFSGGESSRASCYSHQSHRSRCKPPSYCAYSEHGHTMNEKDGASTVYTTQGKLFRMSQDSDSVSLSD